MTEARATGQPATGPEVPGGPGRRRLPRAAILASLAVAAAAAVGLYGIASHGGKRAAHAGACARSLDLAQAADPLARGDVAALMLASTPNDLGSVAFDMGGGGMTTIGAFKGRTILLNLWATWCVPCRAEMPALDRLEGELGSARFAVVPVDVDTTRLDRPRAFLREIGATHLGYYADNSADILQVLHGKGLPTTILIGPDGCEIGTMAGPAPWDSPDARALIARVVDPAQGA